MPHIIYKLQIECTPFEPYQKLHNLDELRSQNTVIEHNACV